jgi:hypothetical protein
MDSLLIHEVAGELTTDEREQAIDRLLELGRAVDGVLAQQIELDIDALQQAPRRTFTDADRVEIRTHQRRAYRWSCLVSGLQHPNFVRIVEQLATTGTAKIATAARAPAARIHPSVGNHVDSKGEPPCPFSTDPQPSLA